jgi:sporulation protein YlmC with PRC-barrel domain
MKSRWLIIVLGCGLVSLWTAALMGERPATAPPSRAENSTDVQPLHPGKEHSVGAEHRTVFRTSGLIGMTVKNQAGKDLGTIEDLVIDSKTGEICYAALARGGFLTGGKKLYAVPWNAFELRRQEREQLGFRGDVGTEKAVASKGEVQLILSIDPTVLDKKEGFNHDRWPEAGDPSFGEHMSKLPAPGTSPGTLPEKSEYRNTDD